MTYSKEAHNFHFKHNLISYPKGGGSESLTFNEQDEDDTKAAWNMPSECGP